MTPSTVVAHTIERGSLLATLTEVGPDAPTLCAPWTASTVAAHLVVSEARAGVPWVAALPVRRVIGARLAMAALERLGPTFDRTTARAEERGWPWLLHRLSLGPPRLFRLPAAAGVRLLEDWVHHEDVRRANGMGPRPSSPALDAALLDGVRAVTALPELAAPRRAVEAVLPDGTVLRISDDPSVRLAGHIGEVLLYLAGRQQVAEVEVSGDPEAVAALGTLRF